MSIIDKLRRNSTIEDANILSKSKILEGEVIPTPVYAMNIAFSGDIDGGFSSGLTQWAGESKHFKTAFCLLMAKAYQDKFPDSAIIFYDSEFGTPKSYFKNFNIDMSRVLHSPLYNLEELKFDIIKQLEQIDRKEHVMIVVDSIGNLASKKEVDDAKDEKSVSDMSRAKQMKSLFRMVTPYLRRRDIPMVVVNHIYMTQELYAKPVVSGGTGSYLSADNIYILGRQQEKDETGLTGFNFIINVDKSRTVREKSKIPVEVSFEEGINTYSGLIDIAMETGHVTKPSKGWYARVNTKTGEVESKNWRLSDTNSAEFWNQILNDVTFKEAVRNKFRLVKDEDEDDVEDEDE
jgi:RecA/RadA recombinase